MYWESGPALIGPAFLKGDNMIDLHKLIDEPQLVREISIARKKGFHETLTKHLGTILNCKVTLLISIDPEPRLTFTEWEKAYGAIFERKAKEMSDV